MVFKDMTLEKFCYWCANVRDCDKCVLDGIVCGTDGLFPSNLYKVLCKEVPEDED